MVNMGRKEVLDEEVLKRAFDFYDEVAVLNLIRRIKTE